MTTPEPTTATAVGTEEHLALLDRERASAALNGDADDDVYIEDLRDELEATCPAYVAAVTEIASLRAALGGWPALG